MTDVIYENPAAPWNPGELITEVAKIPGYFPALVRLGDPAYYTPANPHTDDEGRLPHDGGPMPEHVTGKRVEFKRRDSHVFIEPADELCWDHSNPSDVMYESDIIAYRVVGDGSEEREADASERCPRCCTTHSDGEVCGDPGDDPAYPTPAGGMILGLTQANYAAIHLGVPVPGMSEWLREPLRESRRLRYQEAALTGLCSDSGASPGWAEDIAVRLLEQENGQ